MEKRVAFRSRWLPYVLVAPQLAITIVFFFWPASQAIVQSVQQQDPFGISVEFVGLDNFVMLFNDEHYLASFKVTAIFSVLVAFFGSLNLLAVATLGEYLIKIFEETKRRPKFIRKAIRHAGARHAGRRAIAAFLRERRRAAAPRTPKGTADVE